MKINSAFARGALCPNCKRYVIGQRNQRDPAWRCVFCPAMICSWCFSTHTETVHPEKYAYTVTLVESPPEAWDPIRALLEVTDEIWRDKS